MPGQTKILIVEDEPLIRMNMTLALEEYGFSVLEAANADEAVALLKYHEDIGVLFTDIQMPGSMDGVALANYVREKYPPTMIIVCSGNILPKRDQLPQDARFLAKPINSEILEDAVHLIERRLEH